jgi:threonine aldolase
MQGRYDFASDNTAPAAPEAMAALVRANEGFAPAYGEDATTARAGDLVRTLLDADAEVRFLASGTAANSVALAALCRPFEAVIAHEHAHVATAEAGAPAFFGGGLAMIPLPGPAGKISVDALEAALASPDDSHRQGPGALSLTNATEYGTVYGAQDLAARIAPARAAGLKVHLDGARLANAAAHGLDLKQLKSLGVDMLVLGGTKGGMPGSEALVIFDPTLSRRIGARLKQSGQLPSKSRYLAAPFLGMLEDGALLRRAAHANAMARRLAAGSPFPVRHPVEANGVFLDMDEARLAALHAAGWIVYPARDGSVRVLCSWVTTPDTVDEMCAALQSVR